jgi:hypothetical protein
MITYFEMNQCLITLVVLIESIVQTSSVFGFSCPIDNLIILGSTPYKMALQRKDEHTIQE